MAAEEAVGGDRAPAPVAYQDTDDDRRCLQGTAVCGRLAVAQVARVAGVGTTVSGLVTDGSLQIGQKVRTGLGATAEIKSLWAFEPQVELASGIPTPDSVAYEQLQIEMTASCEQDDLSLAVLAVPGMWVNVVLKNTSFRDIADDDVRQLYGISVVSVPGGELII